MPVHVFVNRRDHFYIFFYYFRVSLELCVLPSLPPHLIRFVHPKVSISHSPSSETLFQFKYRIFKDICRVPLPPPSSRDTFHRNTWHCRESLRDRLHYQRSVTSMAFHTHRGSQGSFNLGRVDSLVASGAGAGVGRGGSGVFATVRTGSTINMNPAMFRSRSGDEGGSGSSRSRRVLDRQASAIHQASMIRHNAAIHQASFARLPKPPTGAAGGGGSGSGRLSLVGGSTQRSFGVSGAGDGGSESFKSVSSSFSSSDFGSPSVRGGDSEWSVPGGAFAGTRAHAARSRKAGIAALDEVDSSMGTSFGSSGFDTSASGRYSRRQQHQEQQTPKGIAFRPVGHSRSKSSGSGGSGDSTSAATLAATTSTTVAGGNFEGTSARGRSHRPTSSAGDLGESFGRPGGSGRSGGSSGGGSRGTASAVSGRPTATVASLMRDSKKSGAYARDASQGLTKVGDGVQGGERGGAGRKSGSSFFSSLKWGCCRACVALLLFGGEVVEHASLREQVQVLGSSP